MSYEARIAALTNVRPHPNADRIKLATVLGHQVVVSLDSEEGQLGVFFAEDGQLSEEYAKENDLIRRKNPTTGEAEGGFFEEKRRVRAQSFRGEKSEGYFAPLSSLSFACDISTLKIGDAFTELNGVPICNKYITPATRRAGANVKAKKKNQFFAEHVETKKLQYYVDQIPEGSLLYVSEKLHGTSHRVGRVLEEIPIKRSLLDRILRRTRTYQDYRVLSGTRRVVLDDKGIDGFYGDPFRNVAIDGIVPNLLDGEVIYGEIVGYTTENSPIMPPHSTKDVKEYKKEFGDYVHYNYGQPEGTCKFYIYRITQVSPSGKAIELPWFQVVARAKQLGVPTVPHEEGPVVARGVDVEALVLRHGEGPSNLSPFPREGACLRVEAPNGNVEFYKYKNFNFGVMEGYAKSKDDYVDLEESA